MVVEPGDAVTQTLQGGEGKLQLSRRRSRITDKRSLVMHQLCEQADVTRLVGEVVLGTRIVSLW